MDWKEAFMYLGGLAIAGLSWYVRGMVADLKDLQSAIAAHRLHVSETYARKSEYDKLRDWLDERFNELFNELKGKADK